MSNISNRGGQPSDFAVAQSLKESITQKYSEKRKSGDNSTQILYLNHKKSKQINLDIQKSDNSIKKYVDNQKGKCNKAFNRVFNKLRESYEGINSKLHDFSTGSFKVNVAQTWIGVIEKARGSGRDIKLDFEYMTYKECMLLYDALELHRTGEPERHHADMQGADLQGDGDFERIIDVSRRSRSDRGRQPHEESERGARGRSSRHTGIGGDAGGPRRPDRQPRMRSGNDGADRADREPRAPGRGRRHMAALSSGSMPARRREGDVAASDAGRRPTVLYSPSSEPQARAPVRQMGDRADSSVDLRRIPSGRPMVPEPGGERRHMAELPSGPMPRRRTSENLRPDARQLHHNSIQDEIDLGRLRLRAAADFSNYLSSGYARRTNNDDYDVLGDIRNYRNFSISINEIKISNDIMRTSTEAGTRFLEAGIPNKYLKHISILASSNVLMLSFFNLVGKDPGSRLQFGNDVDVKVDIEKLDHHAKPGYYSVSAELTGSCSFPNVWPEAGIESGDQAKIEANVSFCVQCTDAGFKLDDDAYAKIEFNPLTN